MGCGTKGASTDPNYTPPPRVSEGPRLDRDPRYPDRIQNGLSGGGSYGGGGAGGTGGGSGGYNEAETRWRMGVEHVNGTINGQPYRVQASMGTDGWIQMEGKPHKDTVRPYDQKKTGHPDGNVHYHTTHPDGSKSDILHKSPTGTLPQGSVYSKFFGK
jgi:hypothetical protein